MRGDLPIFWQKDFISALGTEPFNSYLFIRDRRVDSFDTEDLGNPAAPVMRHPVFARTFMIYLRPYPPDSGPRFFQES